MNDAAIVSKKAAGELGYQLDTTVDTGPRTIRMKFTDANGSLTSRYGATVLQLNQWYHVARVYDAEGGTLNVYLNGVLDNGTLLGTVTTTQLNSPVNVNIGRRPGESGYEFNGTIDEVRIYNRALTQAEIQADMNISVSTPPPDVFAPTAPTGLSATAAGGSQINLSWTAASDNVGVTGYRVERCQGAGCTSFAQIATPTGTSFTDTGLAAATSYSYRVRATDAAGNLSGYSNVVSATTGGAAAAQMYYIHPDHLNTPRMIANATGATVWRWDQGEPFGNDVPNNNPSGAGAFDFPLRFPGQYFDRETGLAYNAFRDFDASLGRYVQADPLGLLGGLNPFLYVGAGPLAYIDIWGLSRGVCKGKTPSEFNPDAFQHCTAVLVARDTDEDLDIQEKGELDRKFSHYMWKNPSGDVGPNWGTFKPGGLRNPPIRPEIKVDWYKVWQVLMDRIVTMTYTPWVRYHMYCRKPGPCGTVSMWDYELTFCSKSWSKRTETKGWEDIEEFIGRYRLDWFRP